MREHFGIDQLVEHGISPLPETARLINPAWRALDSQDDSFVEHLCAELNTTETHYPGTNLRLHYAP